MSRSKEIGLVPHQNEPLAHCAKQITSLRELRVTICPSDPTPGQISREESNLKRYVHPNIHSSQDTEAT